MGRRQEESRAEAERSEVESDDLQILWFVQRRERQILVLNTAYVVHVLFNDRAGLLCHLAPPSLINDLPDFRYIHSN
jgi:hypothetical protein